MKMLMDTDTRKKIWGIIEKDVIAKVEALDDDVEFKRRTVLTAYAVASTSIISYIAATKAFMASVPKDRFMEVTANIVAEALGSVSGLEIMTGEEIKATAVVDMDKPVDEIMDIMHEWYETIEVTDHETFQQFTATVSTLAYADGVLQMYAMFSHLDLPHPSPAEYMGTVDMLIDMLYAEGES